jgi:hypothetical protein
MILRGPSSLWSVLYFLGLALVYLGERIIGGGRLRWMFTATGGLLVGLAFVIRLIRITRATGERRRAEAYILGLYGLGLAALVLYFGQSDLLTSLGAKPLRESAPRLAVILAALWPALIASSLLPLLLLELSYGAMARAPEVEAGRVRDAMLSGLAMAAAGVFAFSVVYVSSERDAKWDLSYFRTAKPGASTRKIVQALTEPIEVSLFYPPANEVRDELAEYFQDLGRESKQLEVHYYDQAVDPAKARDLGVSNNGAVMISRGSRREQLMVGVELERARSQLRNLDQEIQKRLLAVGKARRVLYLTTGHGERSSERGSQNDQRSTIVILRDLLSSQNFDLRNLSASEGLASEVPADAAAVLVIGPSSAFLPEESAALKRYFERGGRIWLALDPEPRLDFKEVLGSLGLSFAPTVLCNDQVYARITNQPSDRAAIATASFSSHPSVTTLSSGRVPIVLIGAGSLEQAKDKPAEISVDFTLRSHPATWNDLNRNYQFDPPAEARKPWQLAAAVTKKKAGDSKPDEGSRAIVLADSDAFSDALLQFGGNYYFALDGIRWLLGDEAIAGPVTSEVDVPIEHTRKQDVFWFYSTIFAVPAMVLLVGFWVTRRRLGKRKIPASEAQ